MQTLTPDSDIVFRNFVRNDCLKVDKNSNTLTVNFAQNIVNAEDDGECPGILIPYSDNTFDSVAVLETVERPGELFARLEEALRVAKPGAIFQITYPRRAGPEFCLTFAQLTKQFNTLQAISLTPSHKDFYVGHFVK